MFFRVSDHFPLCGLGLSSTATPSWTTFQLFITYRPSSLVFAELMDYNEAACFFHRKRVLMRKICNMTAWNLLLSTL